MNKTFKLSLIVLLVLAWASLTFAGDSAIPAQTSGTSLKGAPNVFSLLSSSKIKWSHSYSVSFFTGGNQSGSLGMFRTSMLYEISPKLSVQLNVGIQHQGGVLSSDTRNKPNILPGFSFDYHPSEKFRFVINVQKVSGVYYNPYYYSGGFWPDLLDRDK